MKKMILLIGRYDRNAEKLRRSLLASGLLLHTVSAEYDGFMPEEIASPYAYYTGAGSGPKGEPLYFDRLRVPRFWEIRADNGGGNVYDNETRKAQVFFAEPKSLRFIRTVDWKDGRDKTRLGEHYDRYGRLFARTVLNADAKRILRTYYDREGCGVITENYVTGSVLLEQGGKLRMFENRTAFLVHFLKETGWDLGRIGINSLSYPFFVSERLGNLEKIPGEDVLFWQEPVGNTVPGNMKGILDGTAARCRRVFVQSRTSRDRLEQLGVPEDRIGNLGYIYEMKGRNAGSPNALVLTNSDQVEKLSELAALLPEVTFYVGAVTEMSQKLRSLAAAGNIVPVETIRQERVQELMKRCDLYLDINHGNEILDAVSTAFYHDRLILGFSGTLHDADYTAPAHVFSPDRPEDMAGLIRRALRDRDFLRKCLDEQHRHAMAETPEGYRAALGE